VIALAKVLDHTEKRKNESLQADADVEAHSVPAQQIAGFEQLTKLTAVREAFPGTACRRCADSLEAEGKPVRRGEPRASCKPHRSPGASALKVISDRGIRGLPPTGPLSDAGHTEE